VGGPVCFVYGLHFVVLLLEVRQQLGGNPWAAKANLCLLLRCDPDVQLGAVGLALRLSVTVGLC
jgi:hypothetical protein